VSAEWSSLNAGWAGGSDEWLFDKKQTGRKVLSRRIEYVSGKLDASALLAFS
jgi:hypothetical protein